MLWHFQIFMLGPKKEQLLLHQLVVEVVAHLVARAINQLKNQQLVVGGAGQLVVLVIDQLKNQQPVVPRVVLLTSK